MARIALLTLLLFVASVQSKEAKKEACAACDKNVAKLEKQLEASLAENAALKKQLGSAGVPYLSTGVIVDSLGSVTNLALGQGSLNVDLKPVYAAADVLHAHSKTASEQATVAASHSFAAVSKAVLAATAMAKDLHGKHVSQHTAEYYKTTMDTYTAHLEPHISTARKAYYDSVHPHVGKASDAVYAGVGAAAEGSKTITPKVHEFVRSASKTMSEASSGNAFKQLSFLVTPQTFTVMGRTFEFSHGYLDMTLAAVQGVLAFYFVFMILWKLCLKTLVWNIGIKLLGKKVFIGLTSRTVKVSFKVTRFIISLALYLVFTAVAIAFSWLMLAVCGGLGVGLLHAVEKNFAVGLTAGMRLAGGIGAGLFFYIICRCTCCKKRKAAKGKDAKPAKAEAKKAVTKTDAKQAPAKPTKKK